jgi:DNA helicase-2/ATP-dependent DNA helicase PcrA
MPLDADLSVPQRDAAQQMGTARVLAGPGTGKTKTLINHVNWLSSAGVYPSNMAVLSLTNKVRRRAAGASQEAVRRSGGDNT